MINILNILSTSAPVTDVWVRAGQSNQVGATGGVSPVDPYVTPNPNAYIMGAFRAAGTFGDFTTVENFEIMDFNAGNFLGNRHGAEASVAYNYAINQPGRDVYIVKVSQGGTSLHVDWASDSSLRNELISKMNAAKLFFQQNNIKVRWIWSWNQWEADMLADRSPAYKENYQGLITEITNSTGINFSRHLIFKINPNSGLYNVNFGPAVLQAQQENALIYGADLVVGDDLSFHDGHHYTSTDYHVIGTREYQTIYPTI